ncbi:putative ribonuclease H-like domain-containing protein, partial [Tanacetum coccineum]
MGDKNPIRTLGDYSRPSHEGYRNTIELPEGNNVVPLRSDTIRLVQNGCSFHGLRSEDPNQHLKDFLKLVDSLNLDVANRERTRLRSISTWEDLTTRFLAQFFPSGRTAKLRNDILIPNPQHHALGTTFEARVRDYMAAHTERMKRFENAIFKQREEINNKITEMFRLLKELMTSRASENEAEKDNEAKNGTKKEPIKSAKKELTRAEEEEAVEAPSSQSVGYYLKHRINEKLIEELGLVYEAILKKNITKKEDIGGNFEIPCNIGGLKHMNALVDQGSDMNVMPLSTYRKLTDERPAKIDIRLSLASHSYIYPLRIAEDVLVDVVGYVYPVDFVIMDIKEDEKRPFILGTPFLTTAKVVIKFDKGNVTLRFGKSKMSFHRIPESLCKIEKGIKNDIEPIAPTMTVNKLVLEWEERIKLHQEKEMEFDQWRSKTFKNKHPALVKVKIEMNDEGEVMIKRLHDDLRVIVAKNGNAPLITKNVEGVETIIAPATAEEKAQRSTNSTNRAVNTAHSATTASTQATAINSTTIDNLSDAKRWILTVEMPIANNEGKEILKEHWKKAYCEWNQENKNRENTRRVVPVETTTSNDLLETLMAYSSTSSNSEFVNKPIVSEPTTKKPVVETSEAKTSADKTKAVRKNNGAQIIEDWVSDSEEEDVPQAKKEKKIDKSSFAKIEFVKSKEQVKSPRNTTVKQGNQNRLNIHSPRGNQRNWNNMMSQRLRSNFEMINKAFYVCGSFDHLQMTHPSPKRNMVPKAVLIRSGLVSLTTARPVNTAQPKTTLNSARLITNVFNKAHSTVRRPINNKTTTKNNNFNKRVNTVSGKNVNTARPKAVLNVARPKAVLNDVKGNQVNDVKASACWVWKPKTKVIDHVSKHNSASTILKRHMIGNMSYLTDFEEIDGGYVAFGGNLKGGKITGRGTIKTGNLDFENLYFVRELQFNHFSVSQMCDKKNSVLFNDTECIVLPPNFKLTDESHVLQNFSRKNNMYSVDLKNIVPKGGLTYLFAKATYDEFKLWHRRLGHINFKTMNKLVKGNLVRGLSSKFFENDQTCIACQKGKQHRASCKSKIVSLISQHLHMLHMDLFGLTFVKSLMKKMYCLVVTDDYSRFSWVFFLATKDETSGILKSFITGVKNLIDQRVKVIRCDNGTEFKNKEMNQFCERKGIKREFSVARTPQQNGVAERKNRTLIEAARTMLADSKLPTTFWAEAVNTACYVQNRVLVTKPHNKTPYELFLGRKPALGFMRPFGCPVTILNTIDHLGKFDGKADEGFFVGYSINSKAFRVFNSRTRIVEENLHVQFSENTPNIAGSGPNWLFNIDALTKSMNYKPVIVGNQSNGNAGTKACDDAGKARMETVPGKDYILLPLCLADLPFSENSKSSPDDGFKPLVDNEKKVTKELGKEGGDSNNDQEKEDDNDNSTNNVNTASDGNITNNVNYVSLIVNVDPPFSQSSKSSPDVGFKPSGDDEKKVTEEPGKEGADSSKDSEHNDQEKEDNVNSTNTINVASTNEVNGVGAKTSIKLPDDPIMPELEDIVYSDDDEDVSVEANMNNLDAFMPVSPILATRINKEHPVEQIISNLNSAPQTRRMTKNLEEH